MRPLTSRFCECGPRQLKKADVLETEEARLERVDEGHHTVANSFDRLNVYPANPNVTIADPATAHSTPTAFATAPVANDPITCDSPMNTSE